MRHNKLDQLIGNGTIKTYSYENVDDEGNVGKKSSFRNTQQLTIEFLNGQKLIVDTFCSGSAEDTSLHFRVQDDKTGA